MAPDQKCRIVCSIMVLLLIMTACADRDSVEKAGRELAGTVRVYLYQDDFFSVPDYGDALAAFRAQQPALTVQTTVFHDQKELASLLLQDLEAGTPPDVVLCNSYGGTDVYRLFAEGFLTDLTPYLERDGGFSVSAYYAAALDACRMERTTFALPLSLSPALLLSSEERLADAGLN